MQQLAGDLSCRNATREQRLATAFNRLHRQTNEGGSIEEEWRTEYVSDRVAHLQHQHFLASPSNAHAVMTTSTIRSLNATTIASRHSSTASMRYGLYNDTAHCPRLPCCCRIVSRRRQYVETATELERRRKTLEEAKAAATAQFPEWSRTNKNWNIPGLVAPLRLRKTETNNQFASVEGLSPSSAALGANAWAEGHHGESSEVLR